MPVSQMSGASPSIISIMPLHLKIQGAPAGFTPKGTLSLEGEDGRAKQKEHKPRKGLQTEATVLGVIQILCSLVVSGPGIILASAPFSSGRSPAVSSSVTSGFPLAGGLCFAVSGFLSIISGKKSTKPLAKSSLVSNAVSSAAAGAGIFLLTYHLVALGTAAQSRNSERECLSSLPYSQYYYSIYELEDCLLADLSLTGRVGSPHPCPLAARAPRDATFAALELLLAAYASDFWCRQICSAGPGVSAPSSPPVPACPKSER
ncbi:membrane-spanning 4-domains subfamily A member 7 [Erethizon dorsatum]